MCLRHARAQAPVRASHRPGRLPRIGSGGPSRRCGRTTRLTSMTRIASGPRRRLLAHLIAFGCTGLSIACDAPTAPNREAPPSINVSLRVAAVTSQLLGVDTARTVQCDIDFEATADGKAKGLWTGVKLRYFSGVDRQGALDSLYLSAAETQLFTSDTILASRADTSSWRFTAPFPFAIEGEFQYTRLGTTEVRSASARADCGAVPPADAAVPSVEYLDVRGSDDTLEAGDTLVVRYRLTGPAGLWKSVVSVAGPFEAVRARFEEQAVSVEREERFVVPLRSRAGDSVDLAIRVTDNAGRTITADRATGIVVVDVRRPALHAVNMPNAQAFYVGEAVIVDFLVTDDNDLARVFTRLEGDFTDLDSVAVSGGGSTSDRRANVIESKPEWVGQEVRGVAVWAVDAAGNVSDTVRLAGRSLTFYPSVATPASAGQPIVLPHTPGDIVVDPRHGRFYVVHDADSALSVVNVPAWTREPTIRLPEAPRSADLSVSGDSLLIAHSYPRRLSVLDLGTLALRQEIPLQVFDSIALFWEQSMFVGGVRVAANGRAIVGSLNNREGFALATVDLATGDDRLRRDASGLTGVAFWWKRMFTSADRSRVYVNDPACSRVYVAATDAFTPCRAGPDIGPALDPSFSASGDRILLGRNLFDRDLQLVDTLRSSESAVLLPSGTEALVSIDRDLRRIRVSDGTFLSRMQLPFSVMRLVLLDDGHTLLVFGWGRNVVKVDIRAM